jgi:sugar/nucleoside kinase (ribokinase family)
MNQPRLFDSVTVFGSATLDRVARSDGAPIMGASNPGKVRRLPGGVGFNVSAVLARLGIPTRLVSIVGDDSDGEAILTAAKGVGVDTAGISVQPHGSTAGYHATFDDQGNLIVGIADMTICEAMTPALMADSLVLHEKSAFWVVDANLPRPTLEFLAEEAKARRHPLAALTVSPAKAGRITPIMDRVAYLFTNLREAAAIVGHDPQEPGLNAAKLATELAGMLPTKVIVTNGREPLAAANRGEVRSFAPFRAAVKGVNGAGDSFAAGTIHALTTGLELNDAIRFGLAAAALTLEAGSILSAPFSQDALAERIAGPAEAERRIA